MYIAIPSVGMWTQHPFSIAWSETEAGRDEKLHTDSQNNRITFKPQSTTMSVIMRRRTGFTNYLYTKASQAAGPLSLWAIAEGPYGLQRSLDSYGTVILFAAGVGITHQLPYIRSLVAAYPNHTAAIRKLALIWVIQQAEHTDWIRSWMTEVSSMDRSRELLKVQVFVTKPASKKEILQRPHDIVHQVHAGRPNVGALLDIELAHCIGAVGVSVCGTGGMQDEVRNAVRQRQRTANMDYIEESFSW